MDVAVLGATGDVGRQVCTQLVERALLPTSSRLQLVGRAGGASERAAHGLRADLIDAYDEHAPIIDVALDPNDVVADVIVVAAGRTSPPASDGMPLTRAELAADNHAVFAAYADALAAHGSGSEVVVVVSNPVELGVAVMANRLGRHRVGGCVAGEHGDGVVPLWSTVRISGRDVPERQRAVASVRGPRTLDTFGDEIAAAKAQLAALDTAEAFRLIDTWPPDLRVVARPWMTHQSGAKTATGTANATIDLLDTILDGRDIVVAGQVALAGEVSVGGEPVHGVLGVPVVLGQEGWSRVLLDELSPDEDRRLSDVARSIATTLEPWADTVSVA